MASQNVGKLWRVRIRLGLGLGLATLVGAGLTSRAKARLDAPDSQGKTQRENEIKVLQKQQGLQVAREFCTFADSSPSYVSCPYSRNAADIFMIESTTLLIP